MKATKKTTMWLVALGLGITLPLAAFAQPGGGPDGERGPRDGQGEFRGQGKRGEKLRAMHERLLKEKVGLDDARVAKVQAIHKQFDVERKALREDMKTAHEALKVLVDGNSSDTKAYEKAIAAAKTARARLHELRQNEQAAIANLLNAKEQATLMVAMHKVQKHRGMRGHRGKGARGEGGEWGGRRGGKGGGEGFGPRGGGRGFGPDVDGD